MDEKTLEAIAEMINAIFRQLGGKGDAGAVRLRGGKRK
jgi:hypothetical protein